MYAEYFPLIALATYAKVMNRTTEELMPASRIENPKGDWERGTNK
jgi:hypothetical protein